MDVVGVASITENLKVGTLNVQGISTYGGNLDINASVDILNNLDVNGTATFNDPVIITDDTKSTSFSTGSLKVTGGVGIGSSVFIGKSLNLLDNNEINIGNDGDLRIFHDGSESFIHDNGTGGLVFLTGSSPIEFRVNSDPSEKMLLATPNGAVELYHAGTKRLETNTTGIFVNDTVTANTFNATDSEVTDITITGLADIFRADIEQLTVVNGVGIATIKEIDATHTDTDTLNVGTAATTAKLTVDNIEIDGNNITATTGNLIISGDGSSFVKIDKVEITDTTDFSGANAALIVQGGADINKKLNVDGAVTFTKDTESTSPTTGALKITGGVGIAKTIKCCRYYFNNKYYIIDWY